MISISLKPEIYDKVESWVIMLALENLPQETVVKWKLNDWKLFYKRISKNKNRV